MKQREPSFFFFFILMLLVSFASVSAVLFTPSLPEITQKMQISDSLAQWTMTAFLIGYAFGNLPYGPFSNRFGRKITLFTGIGITIVGIISVILVDKLHMFSLFILGRLLMGLGSGVGMKISFTMIGDVYSPEVAVKKISHFLLSFAIAPAIAVAIGGFLTTHFSWISCFYFLIGYSLFLAILSMFLPETLSKPDMKALNVTNILEGYLQQFKNQKLLICAFLMGTGTSIIYLFATMSPFIGIEHIGLSPEIFGLYNLIPIAGMVCGSLLAHSISGKKEPLTLILWGGRIMFFGSAVILALFLMGYVNVWTLFCLIPFVYIGNSFSWSNSSAMALSHSQNKSNASAVMNFLNMGSSVVAFFIIGMMPANQLYMMPLFFTLLGLSALFLWRRLSKTLAKKA